MGRFSAWLAALLIVVAGCGGRPNWDDAEDGGDVPADVSRDRAPLSDAQGTDGRPADATWFDSTPPIADVTVDLRIDRRDVEEPDVDPRDAGVERDADGPDARDATEDDAFDARMDPIDRPRDSSEEVRVDAADVREDVPRDADALSEVTPDTPDGCNELTCNLVALMLSPNHPVISPYATQRMVAVASYFDGSTRDVTTSVHWSVSSAVAHASNSPGKEGLVTARTSGNGFVNAALGAVSGSTAIDVMTADPYMVRVIPGAVSLASGMRRKLKAVAFFSDRASTLDWSSHVTWTTSDPTAVAIYGSVVAAGAPGRTTTVTASSPFLAQPATVPVTVTTANLIGLTVEPAASTLPIERTRPLKAIGHFIDGSTHDLTENAVWGSLDSGRATVNDEAGSKGKVLGVGAGTATISASYGQFMATATVDVSAATLQSMSYFYPNNGRLLLFMPFTMSLRASFSDGSLLDVSDQATLVSSDPTLLQPWGGATVLGIDEGSGWVDAQVGSHTERIFLEVHAGELASLAIQQDPIPPLARGEAISLNAIATDTDGSTYDLSWFIPWFTDDPAVAWLEEARPELPPRLIAAGVGTTTVRAGWASVGASSAVEVR